MPHDSLQVPDRPELYPAQIHSPKCGFARTNLRPHLQIGSVSQIHRRRPIDRNSAQPRSTNLHKRTQLSGTQASPTRNLHKRTQDRSGKFVLFRKIHRKRWTHGNSIQPQLATLYKRTQLSSTPASSIENTKRTQSTSSTGQLVLFRKIHSKRQGSGYSVQPRSTNSHKRTQLCSTQASPTRNLHKRTQIPSSHRAIGSVSQFP